MRAKDQLTCRPLVLSTAVRPRPYKKSTRTQARVWVNPQES